LIEIERATARGDPGEGPAQAPPDLLDARERCARDRNKCQVDLGKGLPRHINVIGNEGAPLADLIGAGRQHEVIDGELTATLE